MAAADPAHVAEVEARGIVGAAESVAERLTALCTDAAANELFILTIAETAEARIKSYELLTRAWANV